MKEAAQASSGVGNIFGLLGVVFVTLKLLGKITWSWWLVTLPFWGGLAVILVIGAIVAAVYGLTKLAGYAKR